MKLKDKLVKLKEKGGGERVGGCNGEVKGGDFGGCGDGGVMVFGEEDDGRWVVIEINGNGEEEMENLASVGGGSPELGLPWWWMQARLGGEKDEKLRERHKIYKYEQYKRNP